MTATEAEIGLRIPESAWQDGIRAIRAAESVVLVCHVAPDGDALGSMLALAQALRRRGVEVACSWGDERWARPASWGWLPGISETTPPGDLPATADLLVVLDTSARDRLGVLAPRLAQAGSVVVIDHHAHGADIEPAVHLVDPEAAATAVIVAELLARLGTEIDPAIATCLYAGLVTDTGSFSHAVTTPTVHLLAARLLAAGVRPDEVARQIWGTRPLGAVRLLATGLARVRFDPDAAGGRGLVWTWVTKTDLAAEGLGLEDADAAMEIIRGTAEADVAVLLKQDVDGVFKASTRSRGGSDVGAACAALGGGGHRLAAGFTASGKLADLDPAGIVAAFDAALR